MMKCEDGPLFRKIMRDGGNPN